MKSLPVAGTRGQIPQDEALGRGGASQADVSGTDKPVRRDEGRGGQEGSDAAVGIGFTETLSLVLVGL